MNTKKFLTVFSTLTLSLVLFTGFIEGDKNKKLAKPDANDDYKFIAVNNVLMWISNNGDGSHDPRTDGSGFYWPGGINSDMSAIFEDGLIYGAKVRNEIRVNGNTHRQGLQAGKIINGIPDDPSLEKYRVYKIMRGWESLPDGPEKSALEKDYLEWPIEDGAPYEDVNGDGKPTRGIDKPKFIGDETLWYVANDMDTSRSRFTYGTDPMGLEFQTTVFGFKKYNILGDVVFKKYKIINKGENILKDMYIAYWSDPDLGEANDDYSGCDTTLKLGYVWNADNSDRMYGENPPAVGYTLLQGSKINGTSSDSILIDNSWRKGFKDQSMTSFMMYNGLSLFPDPPQGHTSGSVEFYNYLRSINWDGSPIIDPVTGQQAKYLLSGDPVNGTGWYEGTGWPGGPSPGDRRMLLSSGPINFAPSDTQEIIVAIHIARGTDNLNSITQLKQQSSIIRKGFINGFGITPPENPQFSAVPLENKAVLWWQENSENYEAADFVLTDTITINLFGNLYNIKVTDTTYNFEGYKIWQFKDELGKDPRFVTAFDINNGTNVFYRYPYGFLRKYGSIPFDPYFKAPDEGLRKFFTVTSDAYTGEMLLNGSEYFFAVTAYAYSEFSDPQVIESSPVIMKVTPGRPPVDQEIFHPSMSTVNFEHTGGWGDGTVFAKIIDPSKLTGDPYTVKFSEVNGNILYSLINTEMNDTLINNSSHFADSMNNTVTDGFILFVSNDGKYGGPIKSVLEINGPAGVPLNPGLNVFSDTQENFNSTGSWTLKAVNERQQINNNINSFAYRTLKAADYEIRFTEGGSEYFTTGYSDIGPILKIDPKGKGKVPFEVWEIPGDTSLPPQRLVIKTFDSKLRDTSWSHVDGEFESIYTFVPNGPYPQVFPPRSTIELGATTVANFRVGNILIKGQLPAAGTVIRFSTWKELTPTDQYSAEIKTSHGPNTALAKQNINNISVFPNPYYATMQAAGEYPSYVRFTNLPGAASIRIFSLAGIFIKKLDKSADTQYIDWDITNKDNQLVGSGVYLAYIEMPGVGTRVMKVAVVR